MPKDGRSYSPILFSQTMRVLKKINKPGEMIIGFGLLADKIKVGAAAMVMMSVSAHLSVSVPTCLSL